MIEDVISLKIKGGVFENETKLSLFSKEKENSPYPRFSLIYGKNGSGKSTISRAFRKIRGSEETKIDLAEILDNNNAPIMLSNEEKKSIYVFNEEFIEDNIRINGEGLNAIIVLGAVKDIDDQIKQIKPSYDKIIADMNVQNEVWSKYKDHNNALCPEYYIKQMQNCLKGDNSWASRDAKIREKKTNTPIKEDTYQQFIGLNPSKKRDELIVDYNLEMEKLEIAKSGSQRIDTKVPTLEEFIDTEQDIVNLLKEKIEKPVLSEREKTLFQILQENNGNQRLANIKLHFKGTKKTTCPFCFQDVSEQYANDLIQSIEKILSKKVEEHQKKLEKSKLLQFEINLSSFKELPPEKVKECEDKLESLNSTIENINKLILQKFENVYEPILENDFKIKKKYEECRESLLELEKTREKFNEEATDTTLIIKNLISINNDIAYYDLKDLNEKYNKQLKYKNYEEKKYKDLEKSEKDLKNELDKLEQEKKNARIAMNAINDDLAYIFFSKTRLRIEYNHDKYILYSHGRAVEPGNVSVGERNAIGLCYFFNHIMENKDEKNVYNSEYLMVIDDPVSSFDMENRIGVLSYLKYKFSQYLKGNDNSKFLLLTHDMQTFYDIRHFMLELLSSKYKKYINEYIKDLEIVNNNVTKIDIRNRNEYTTLLENIFNYAVKIDTQHSFNIGNIMRKVMEAFGTFVYKKGMSQLSTDVSIMSTLSEEDRLYYENLMYRLVLNTGSHMEEKVKTLDDMNFFDYISEEDKQRTARDIICFLYKLNPLHIKAHLKDKANAIENIETWCDLK